MPADGAIAAGRGKPARANKLRKRALRSACSRDLFASHRLKSKPKAAAEAPYVTPALTKSVSEGVE